MNISKRMRGGWGGEETGLWAWDRRKAVGPTPPLPWDTLWVGTQEWQGGPLACVTALEGLFPLFLGRQKLVDLCEFKPGLHTEFQDRLHRETLSQEQKKTN